MSNPLKKTMVYLGLADEEEVYEEPAPRRESREKQVENKTAPVAIVNEFVDGDIYRWGSLMAGAFLGSMPLVILYSFFVEYYVSALTGAVKE